MNLENFIEILKSPFIVKDENVVFKHDGTVFLGCADKDDAEHMCKHFNLTYSKGIDTGISLSKKIIDYENNMQEMRERN